MITFTNVTKYMCTVETKNYPIVTINPIIQRYSSIRKKLNASEIASCLASYAIVTLHKNDGSSIRLTKDNFKKTLIDYKNELLVQETKKNSYIQTKKNKEAIEEMKKEKVEIKEEKIIETISKEEPMEEVQKDPEDPDSSDFSVYEKD